MPSWVRSAGLDAESFHAHFFPYTSARASAQIQTVAAAVGWGDDLRPAMTALAEAVQAVGLDNAPRVLAAAAERATSANAPVAAPAHIIKAQAPLFIFTDPPFLFAQPPEELIARRIPMERVPGQSGKEAASDVPSYARGIPRYVGETPDQFARRVMDDRWGKGNWEGNKERQKDFRKIKKWGSRAYQNPKSTAPVTGEGTPSTKPDA